VLSLIVALLCFLIVAGFLLSLVPEPRRIGGQPAPPTGIGEPGNVEALVASEPPLREAAWTPPQAQRLQPVPLGGLGQPRALSVSRLPVEAADGTHFIDAADIRSIKADAHYTLIHDGSRERMCPWSISEAEAQLDPASFLRVHRSHIVSLPHVSFIRKEGDGAVVELDGPAAHRVPVSRARIAELKARLGLAKRSVATH
jgi:DNA-binding LytR/AlgR family response regulator